MPDPTPSVPPSDAATSPGPQPPAHAAATQPESAAAPRSAGSDHGGLKSVAFPEADIDSLLQDGPAAERQRRYRPEGMIGVGATGEVYAVHDGSLERLVAIKLLRQSLAGNRNEIAGFIAEARTTAQLAHPNVLPVHDLNISLDGRPYFSMGRIKGTILGQAILDSEQGPRSACIATMNGVVNIFISVCNAVGYAHHLGIVHQDIKPDNILIGEFGEVLLLDWGSAGRVDAEGKVRSHIFGTPLYMSPEQSRELHADARSDIFCIGASLFHALLLRYPAWSDDGDRFWEMKRAGAINPPTDQERLTVPPELLAISVKALQADPAARYQTVEQLRSDLINYQEGLAVSAHRDTLARRFARWYARNGKLFWTMMAALLLVGILLGTVIRMRLAEEGAWLEVFQEHFDEPSKAALAERWQVRIQHHAGYGPMQDMPVESCPYLKLLSSVLQIRTEESAVDVICRQVVRGNFRVSWDVAAQGTAANLNCFIGADRTSGFTFHVGGWGDPTSVILTGGPQYDRLQEAHLSRPLELGRVYHMSLEREQRHLRMAIDGHTYIDYIDAENIGGQQGQTFGFDSFADNRITLDNIIVYRQAIAQIISPVEVGDKLFMLENYAEAERQYREISETYPGTELDRSCRYRIALCERHQGRLVEAGQAFDAFAASFPDHELAPNALYQRLQLALTAKNDADIHRVMTSLMAYRGNSILRQALDAYGISKIAFVPLKAPQGILPDQLRSDLETYVGNVMTELRSWSSLYGVEVLSNPFVNAAFRALEESGASESAQSDVAASTLDRERVLYNFGHFQRLVDLGYSDEMTARALLWLGRAKEVAHSPAFPLGNRAIAYLTLNDVDGIRRHACDPTILGQALLMQGKVQELLEETLSDPILMQADMRLRMRVLLEADQAAAAAALAGDNHLAGLALCAQGRYADALAAAPDDTVVAACVAIANLEHGANDTAVPILGRLQDQVSRGHWQENLFASFLLPGVIDAIHGDRALAVKAWRQRLVRNPDIFSTRLRYDVDYLSGAITDQQFLSQPSQFAIQPRLLFMQGLAQDCHGQASAAAGHYQQALSLEVASSLYDDAEVAFMRWRVRAAGMTPHAYYGIGGILP